MEPVSRLFAMLVTYITLILTPILNVQDVLELVTETFQAWNKDRAPQMAAGLAYYAVFAIAPLLVITVSIAGIVFERGDVRTLVVDELERIVGPDTAEIINNTMQELLQPRSGVVATIISIIVILFGAIALLGHIQISLDIIWDVRTLPGPGVEGLTQWLNRMLISFIIVVSSGFLLIVFMILNALFAVVSHYIEQLGSNIALFDLLPITQLGSTLLAWALVSLLFGVMYRTLPGTPIPWGDVWVGAGTIGLLFLIGQDLIGRYIASSGVGSVYGAAGALIVLLVWVYYSAQIFLFGAELTKVYAHKFGSRRPPSRYTIVSADDIHTVGSISE